MEERMNRPCSGLGDFKPCEHRDQCANYRHWLDDPRSEFNVCAALGKSYAHFVPINIPAIIITPGHQMGLF
jgi:hypothetical protein